MEKLAAVFRGVLEESSHFGHLVIADTHGKVVSSLGDANHITYIRSAAKPLQVVPLLLDGLDQEFSFTNQELAVMCGSHGGEEIHQKAVGSILTKIGLDPSYLLCGIHRPFSSTENKRLRDRNEKPSTLHNNCSGKHAAMLALCIKHNYDLSSYLELTHPVQQTMLATVALFAQLNQSSIVTGVDGCGVPVFGLSLSRMAMSYARLTNTTSLAPEYASACDKVVQAMSQHPEMVSATDGLDCRVISAVPGPIVAKVGAEAVYCIGLPGTGLGIALKIIDGNQRALPPVVISLLSQLRLLNQAAKGDLAEFHHPPIKNNRGEIIGHLEATFKLPTF
ncbi:asparaginase [Metallumcola ferriviriculae]|uniref:Asparaginase n=1 Tax=Metallumcola ferriviriculae TaxID=3039180 RepID=A0AAU0UNP6_9FIRM|nr:asparaginase [Desulfitibacteraceae bacterium MK1]